MEAMSPIALSAKEKSRLRALRLLDEEKNEIIDEMWRDQEDALHELRERLEALDVKMSEALKIL